MIYKVPGNFVVDTLQGAITDIATTLELSGTYELPAIVVVTRSFRYNDMLQSETMLLTELNTGVYTVTRDYDSRGARAHDANEYVMFNFAAEHYSGLLAEMTAWKDFLLLAFGRDLSIRTGVISTSLNDYQVVPTATPSLSIRVSTGYCIVNSELNKLSEIQTVVIGAPVSDSRISLVYVNDDGTISVKHGTAASTPVAPDAEPNTLVLAQVTVASTDTEILEGDITDVRTFF